MTPNDLRSIIILDFKPKKYYNSNFSPQLVVFSLQSAVGSQE